MATSITDIAKEVTPEELLEFMLEVAEDAGMPVTAWQTGEPIRAMLEIIAKIGARIWNTGVRPLLLIPLLDYCEGVVLTLVALSIFGTTRTPADFAQGPGTVTNKGSGTYTFAPGEIRIRGSNNKIFTNRTGGSLPIWDGVSAYPELALDFIAEEIGTASTLVPSLTKPVVLSGQLGIEVDHAVAWVGQDEEQDAELRDRSRAQAASNSWGGPKLAYQYFLKSTKRADGKTTIAVNRVKVVPPPGDGTLDLIVAGPSGAVDPSDIALLQTAVEEKAEPLCTTATVSSATNVVFNVTATAFAKKGETSSLNIDNLAKQQLATFFRTAPIGGFRRTEGQLLGKVYAKELETIISGAHPAVYLVDVVGSDVEIQSDEVPALGLVSITVNQVTQP